MKRVWIRFEGRLIQVYIDSQGRRIVPKVDEE